LTSVGAGSPSGAEEAGGAGVGEPSAPSASTLLTLRADFFFFFGLAALPSAALRSSSALGASPLASASETSPGTFLLPRLLVLLFVLFSFLSLSFWSDGLAISTIT